MNNLKQLSLAMLSHEQSRGCFPTGGWGHRWVGDADRGFDWRQPGGWLFNILPYLEMRALHDLGSNGNFKNGDFEPPKAQFIKQVICPAVTHYYCPTRRPPAFILLAFREMCNTAL